MASVVSCLLLEVNIDVLMLKNEFIRAIFIDRKEDTIPF
jgi:hypothetical protein